MARIAEPIIVHKRGKSFQFTLNSTCGLPRRVCAEWQRRSFNTLPDELSGYRNPKTVPEAKANAQVLIAFLKKKQAEGGARRIITDDITVGAWIEKFTAIETSPRTGVNASRNRPYSIDTIQSFVHNVMTVKNMYKDMTMKELFRQLEKLRVQYICGNRIVYPVTKTQRTIFDAFGFAPPV